MATGYPYFSKIREAYERTSLNYKKGPLLSLLVNFSNKIFNCKNKIKPRLFYTLFIIILTQSDSTSRKIFRHLSLHINGLKFSYLSTDQFKFYKNYNKLKTIKEKVLFFIVILFRICHIYEIKPFEAYNWCYNFKL